MEFIKIECIANVKEFAVNERGLHFLKFDGSIPSIAGLDTPKMGFDKYSELALVGDFLLLQDLDGRCIVYDLANDKLIYSYLDLTTKGHGFSNSQFSNNRELVCVKITDEGEYQRYLFDVDNNTYRRINSSFSDIVNQGEYLLDREFSPSAIIRVDIDGKKYWKYSFTGNYTLPDNSERPNKLARIIGACENLLWVSDFNKELFSLSVETGAKVHSSHQVGRPNYYSINKEREMLMSLEPEYFRKIDISNGKFDHEAVSVVKQFDEIGCYSDFGGSPFPIIDSSIIFCNKFKSVVGSYNFDSDCIEWSHDLFDTRDYAMIQELKYFDRKLYVLDNVYSGHNLHIFEQVD